MLYVSAFDYFFFLPVVFAVFPSCAFFLVVSLWVDSPASPPPGHLLRFLKKKQPIEDMSNILNIQLFRPEEQIKPDSNILIIAKKGSGKTTVQFNLCYGLSRSKLFKIDYPYFFTPTADTVEKAEQIMPSCNISEEGFCAERFDRIVQEAQKLELQGKCRHFFIGLDDCTFDTKIFKGKSMRQNSMNSRHLHTTTMMTSQYIHAMGPDLRGNFDYVFVLKENVLDNKKKIHKAFFGMLNYKDFDHILTQCTKNYECLVLDNTQPDLSLDKCIFYYKPSPFHKLPPFRLGSRALWKLSARFAKSKEQIRAEKLKKISSQMADSELKVNHVAKLDQHGNLIVVDDPAAASVPAPSEPHYRKKRHHHRRRRHSHRDDED
jgi:hypothetical protein